MITRFDFETLCRKHKLTPIIYPWRPEIDSTGYLVGVADGETILVASGYGTTLDDALKDVARVGKGHVYDAFWNEYLELNK